MEKKSCEAKLKLHTTELENRIKDNRSIDICRDKDKHDKISEDEVDNTNVLEKAYSYLCKGGRCLNGCSLLMKNTITTTDECFESLPIPDDQSSSSKEYFEDPEGCSTIYIKHEQADNKDMGDEFGVQIRSFRIMLDDGSLYYRHCFHGVVKDGPANEMKIRDNDELILLNAVFVPQVTHEELVHLFLNVKVDGKTRLKLVLRRKEIALHVSKISSEWVFTSAVLAPDTQKEKDNYPTVEGEKFEVQTGYSYEVPPSIKEYKIDGSQFFLEIMNGMVKADVKHTAHSDKTKRICRRACYTMNHTDKHEPVVSYFAALSDENRTEYISIGQGGEITLQRKPFWFHYKSNGKASFSKNGMFLSYNRSSCKIETNSNKFYFDETPPSP